MQACLSASGSEARRLTPSRAVLIRYSFILARSSRGRTPARCLTERTSAPVASDVVIAGAELFTGNNLIIMAWADRKIGSGALMRNLGLVYLGNFVGAIIAVFLLVGVLGVFGLFLGKRLVRSPSLAISIMMVPQTASTMIETAMER